MSKGIQQANRFFLVFLAATALLVLFSAGLSGQVAKGASALMNRPANVPQDYVITPYGYFHSSCVQMLAEGSTLLADGRVEHPNGAIDPAPVCDYPHYTPAGVMVPVDAKELQKANPLEINGWLEAVWVVSSSSYSEISATWPVPPMPTSNDGQVLYFFPGFEDSNDVISIVQPVLQWGDNGYFGGAYWTFASWNCCINGTTWYSSPIDVNVGDTLQGTISPTCKAKKVKYCATWNVLSEDVTTGKSTTLKKTPADGQIWNWAFGAVSEDYGLVQCSDFPDDSGLTFTVALYNQSRQVVSNPSWQGWEASGPSPECNYGTVITPTEETVEY